MLLKNIQFVFHRVENIVEKKQKMLVTKVASFQGGCKKSSLCGKELTSFNSFPNDKLKTLPN